MNRSLLFISLFFVFPACNFNKPKEISSERINSSIQRQPINNQPEQALIQNMLDIPDWQWVYHSDVPGRLPVKILKNDFVNESVYLTKFNRTVQIVSKHELDSQHKKEHIEISELKYTGDTAYFVMHYPSEGATAEGYFIKKNKKWLIDKYTVFEH